MSEIPVTEHFSIAEFACHDSTPYPISCVDQDTNDGRTWLQTRLLPLCQTLEVVRAAAGGVGLHIDSGYRTPAYDERLYEASAKDGSVAPAAKSQHPKGRAADVTHPTMKPLALFNLIMQAYEAGKLPQLGGVGLYPNFVHLDVRPQSPPGHLAIWGGTRPGNVV